MWVWIRNAAWRVLELPFWLFAVLFLLTAIFIGAQQPSCCSPGPVDDNVPVHRWSARS